MAIHQIHSNGAMMPSNNGTKLVRVYHSSKSECHPMRNDRPLLNINKYVNLATMSTNMESNFVNIETISITHLTQ